MPYSQFYPNYVSINDDFETLINFKNVDHQCFPLSFFIIKYIATNCNMYLSQKLMIACKYLRILQIRHGFCHLYECELRTSEIERTWYIKTSSGTIYFTNPFSLSRKKENRKSTTLFQRIKVWNKLYICCNKYTIPFFLTLDLSQLKEIYCINDNSYCENTVLPHSIQEMKIYSQNAMDLIYLFQKMTDLNKLEFRFRGQFIHPQIFKELIGIKRKIKFVECSFYRIRYDYEAEDIFDFADVHIANGGKLILYILDISSSAENNWAHFISKIQKFQEIRKEQQRISAYIIEFNFGTLGSDDTTVSFLQ